MEKVKTFVKLLFSSIFRKEIEYTKKWMARFTVIVFTLLLFYPFLSQELLYLHLTYGLGANLCKMFFSNYTKFAIVLITGYAVTFIGQMWKARLKKESGNCSNLTRAPVNCRSGKKFIERKISGCCRRNDNKAPLF